MKLTRLSAVLSAFFLAALLVGCGKESQTIGNANLATSQPTKAVAGLLPVPDLKVDLSSPDRALKTLFAMQDRGAVFGYNSDIERKAKAAEAPPIQLDDAFVLFDGPAKSWFERFVKYREIGTPTLDVVARDILKVETESETRAIVLVNMKNITPIPAGAELDEYDKKFREEGFNYRYIMTKTGEGWKIEDVQEMRVNVKAMKQMWTRLEEISNAQQIKLRVPSTVTPLLDR